jgi:hypothetical protein
MANQNMTALVLANATASANGADLENVSGRAAHVVIDITSITGTAPTATFTVQGKDPKSGKYYTILASAALNAAATTVLRIGPALTAAANLVANDVMPRAFRVICTTGGTVTDLDATVGVSLVD